MRASFWPASRGAAVTTDTSLDWMISADDHEFTPAPFLRGGG
jgi:hypothetical protein